MEGIRIPGLPGQQPQNQTQNLIKQVPAEAVLRPHGLYQSIILDVLTVGSAALLGYFYWRFVSEVSWTSFGYAGIGFFLLAMCSVLQMLLLWSWKRRVFVTVLEVLALVGFFYAVSWLYLGGVAAIGFFFFMWGEVIARHELKNGLEIRFFKTVRPQLNRFITGITLVTVLLYLPSWDAKKSFFSEETFGTLFGWSSGLAKNFYPELTFDATVGEFARSAARLELVQQQAFRELSPETQASALRDAESDIIKKIEIAFKITLNAKDTMQATAYRLLTDAFAALNEKFGNQFLFVWAVGVFFFVRMFGLIIQLILAFSAATLYQFCLGVNLIHVAGESRTQEVVEYS